MFFTDWITCLENKKQVYEYLFQSQVLKKNKIEVEDKHFIKFIGLTRKIIIDILKNVVKYT